MKIELMQLSFGAGPDEPSFVAVDLRQAPLVCELLGVEDTAWSLNQVQSLLGSLHATHTLDVAKRGPRLTITYTPAGEPPDEMVYVLMGPDGIPAVPVEFTNLGELVQAAATFVLGYVAQGYYKDCRGYRLTLEQVAEMLWVDTRSQPGICHAPPEG